VLGAPSPAGQWVHVAATYRSSDGQHNLFINGVLVASHTEDADGITSLAGKTLRQTSLPLFFGQSYYAKAKGGMDEVRIWNKACTQNEIRGRMFCRLTGSEANLVAYWNFDGGTAEDLTGNGHNGEFRGMVNSYPTIVLLQGEDVIHAGRCEASLDIRVSQIELCWNTMTTNWYQLQYKSSLTSNRWTPFMTGLRVPAITFVPTILSQQVNPDDFIA